MKWCLKFLRDESGPTTVEYAVMIALIITAALYAIQILGCRVDLTFQRASNALK